MRVTDEEFLTPVRCFTPEVADASQASLSNFWTRWIQNLREPRGPCPIRGKYSLSSRPQTSNWTNSNAASQRLAEGAAPLTDRRGWWVLCKSHILHVCSFQPQPSSPGFYCPRAWLNSRMVIMVHYPPCTTISVQKTSIQTIFLRLCAQFLKSYYERNTNLKS